MDMSISEEKLRELAALEDEFGAPQVGPLEEAEPPQAPNKHLERAAELALEAEAAEAAKDLALAAQLWDDANHAAIGYDIRLEYRKRRDSAERKLNRQEAYVTAAQDWTAVKTDDDDEKTKANG